MSPSRRLQYRVTERKLDESNAVRRLREAEAAADRERRQRERLEFLTQLNGAALTIEAQLPIDERHDDVALLIVRVDPDETAAA